MTSNRKGSSGIYQRVDKVCGEARSSIASLDICVDGAQVDKRSTAHSRFTASCSRYQASYRTRPRIVSRRVALNASRRLDPSDICVYAEKILEFVSAYSAHNLSTRIVHVRVRHGFLCTNIQFSDQAPIMKPHISNSMSPVGSCGTITRPSLEA